MEDLPTLAADVRDLCTVRLSHVVMEVGGSEEGPPALLTRERSLSTVGSHMSVQVGGRMEGFPTLPAHVGPLSAVRSPHVVAQVGGGEEGPAALLTHVGPLSAVGSHVLRKAWG